MGSLFSVDGKLKLTDEIDGHKERAKYSPIALGKPMVVELIHVYYGNLTDWWGDSEVVISSWAKTTELGSKSGPQILNACKTGVKKYEHFSDFGAAEYGSKLVYYTPNYQGKEVRFTIGMTELDNIKIDQDSLKKLCSAIKSITDFAVFVPQLVYDVFSDEFIDLANKIYDLIIQDDRFFFEDLDLCFNIPHSKALYSGRYILAETTLSEKLLANTYELDDENRLVYKDNTISSDEIDFPYVVLRINSKEHKEYEDFQSHSIANDIADLVIKNGVSKNVIDLISRAVKTANSII